MMGPDDSTDSTTTWNSDETGNYGVTYLHCPAAGGETSFEIHLRKPRHVPMREQAVPEVPWCEVIPLLPILAREVARRAGRQRGWTGRNFRRVA